MPFGCLAVLKRKICVYARQDSQAILVVLSRGLTQQKNVIEIKYYKIVPPLREKFLPQSGAIKAI